MTEEKSKYYFVVYESRARRDGHSEILNTIIRDIHPVTWMCNPSRLYDKHYVTVMRFWSDISDDVANCESVAKYCSFWDDDD